MNVAEFLSARLAEDEQLARAATAGPWLVERNEEDSGSLAIKGGPDQIPTVSGNETVAYDPAGWEESARDFAHIVRHDPERTLREVAAKRAIINDYWLVTANDAIEQANGADPVQTAARTLIIKSLRMALLNLASAYADHEDYPAAAASVRVPGASNEA